MPNGILERLRELVREGLRQEFDALVGDKLEKRIDERVAAQLPVMVEIQLDKQAPMVVAAEINKMLGLGPKKKDEDDSGEPFDPAAEALAAREAPKQRRKAKARKGMKLGKRPRCKKCGAAARPSDGFCRKCSK